MEKTSEVDLGGKDGECYLAVMEYLDSKIKWNPAAIKKNIKRVHWLIIPELVACGITEEQAKTVIMAIREGKVPAVSIDYRWKPAGFHEFKGDHKMARTINRSECGKG